jgi:hypothetical protein
MAHPNSIHLFVQLDHFKHGMPGARAEVDDVVAPQRGCLEEGGSVALGEVLYVDVVTDAGAVGGVVVLPEDLELGAVAHHDLLYYGEEVVWG